MYDRADRHQFYRLDGGEDFGAVYADGGSLARLGLVSIPRRVCRRRRNRADIGIWLLVGKRGDQGRGERIFRRVYGRAVCGKRRDIRSRDFFLFDGDDLSIAQ